MRKFQFQIDECYHIYNRGVEARDIYIDNSDYLRFLKSMREFNGLEAKGGFYMKYLRDKIKEERSLTSKPEVKLQDDLQNRPLVEFIGYCLNQNHYHFILKQITENGIAKFMQRINTGYTKYYNEKYSRFGSLFQGTYKAIQVNNYGYLLKLLVYVNCNHEIHNLGRAENWPWASYSDSVGLRNGNLCALEIIREEFGEPVNFKSFCKEIIPEIKTNKLLSKYLLE